MTEVMETVQQFIGNEVFPNRSFKVYRIHGRQSGQMLHSHDYMQIWYISRGQCDHWIEGVRHQMVAGEAFIIPPSVPHQTILVGDSEVIGCEFSLETLFANNKEQLVHEIHDSILDLSFMMIFFPETSVRAKYAFSVENQLTVERLMWDILDEYEQDRVFSYEIIQIEIVRLLLLFARQYSDEKRRERDTDLNAAGSSHDVLERHKEAVKSSVDYIDRHYREKLSLEDVCKQSLLSKTYFCYLFKMMTKQTFVEYLVGVRINRAKQLLVDHELNITDISYAVGFSDAAHFSRTFRKQTGLSPSSYRKHFTN